MYQSHLYQLSQFCLLWFTSSHFTSVKQWVMSKNYTAKKKKSNMYISFFVFTNKTNACKNGWSRSSVHIICIISRNFLKKKTNIKRGHYQSLTHSIWSQLHTARAVGNLSVLLFLLTVIYWTNAPVNYVETLFFILDSSAAASHAYSLLWKRLGLACCWNWR